MSNYIERVIEEEAELDCKLIKLTAFNKTEPFYKLTIDEQNDLVEQLYCMSQYSGILRTRIAKAKKFYTGYVSGKSQPACVEASDRFLIEPTNTTEE